MDRLEAYASQVHEDLNKLLAKAGHGGVDMVLGKAAGKEHNRARRIIWNRSQIPCRAERANRKAGGQHFEKTNPAKANREIQGVDRYESAEVKLYAECAESLDALFDQFLTALDLVTGSTDWSQDGIQYIWTVDEGNSQRQPIIAATVRYRSPVAIETKKLVTIAAVINTEQILPS